MKKVLIIALVAIVMVGCGNNRNNRNNGTNGTTETVLKTEEVVVTDRNNARTSLDVTGNYEGTVPCADCDGIKTELRINSNNTYKLMTEYLGRTNDKTFTAEGTWRWDQTGNVIILSGIEDGPSRYKVEENRLRQLDMQGNQITGNLSENYVLKK